MWSRVRGNSTDVHNLPVEIVKNKVISAIGQLCQRFVKTWLRTGVSIAIILTVLLGVALPAKASDHQDTTFLATQRTAADLTDLFVFESPADPSRVVLAMDFDPLITQGENRPFDPSVLYQFKIDNTGDGVEDRVIQINVNGRDPSNQTVSVFGPDRPERIGTVSTLLGARRQGRLNQPFAGPGNSIVFVGTRKDPFFFDLEQFFKVIPDRNYQVQPNPNPPTATSFRPAGQAQDTLAPFNVHSIVIELPRAQLGTGKIGVWMTTSVSDPSRRVGNFAQIERLAIPALNELFMDFSAHNDSSTLR